MLLRCCRGKGPDLALRVESRAFSQVEAGSLPFHSSCDRDFREPLILPQGSQVSFQGASGISAWAQLLLGIWNLPGPGIEPVSPVLAGRFFTTEPPGRPQDSF